MQTAKDYEATLTKLLNRVEGGHAVDKLAAIVISLNAEARAEKTKRLMVEAGSEKLFDRIAYYTNKVIFRDWQIKKMHKLTKRIINASVKITKRIPRREKRRRRAALKYLKRMNKYLFDLMYIKKEEEVDSD